MHPLGQAFVDQQARLVAARHWMLRDESRREVVLELPRFHPTGTLPLTRMEDGAIERAKERVEQRAERAALDALLVRTSEQVDALAAAGWKGVDARLGRVEAVVNRLEQNIQENRGAIVYRMEDRRPDAATS